MIDWLVNAWSSLISWKIWDNVWQVVGAFIGGWFAYRISKSQSQKDKEAAINAVLIQKELESIKPIGTNIQLLLKQYEDLLNLIGENLAGNREHPLYSTSSKIDEKMTSINETTFEIFQYMELTKMNMATIKKIDEGHKRLLKSIIRVSNASNKSIEGFWEEISNLQLLVIKLHDERMENVKKRIDILN